MVPDLWSSIYSLQKTAGKVSPILVTLTSRSDSNFESSNVSLKEAKPDGVILKSNDIDYYVRKNEGKNLLFSADCIVSCKKAAKVSISCLHHHFLLKSFSDTIYTW